MLEWFKKKPPIVVFDNIVKIAPKPDDVIVFYMDDDVFTKYPLFINQCAKILQDLFPKNKSAIIPRNHCKVELIDSKGGDTMIVTSRPENWEHYRKTFEALFPKKKIIMVDQETSAMYLKLGAEK